MNVKAYQDFESNKRIDWLLGEQDSFCIAKEKLKKKLKFLFSSKYFEKVEQLEVKEVCDVK